MAKRFRDPRTRAIIKRIFFLLLPEGGVNGEALQPFEVDLACWGERDARVIRDVSEKVREIVCSSAETSVGQSVEDFERHHWEVTQADLYAEYHRVVEVNFRDEVNWGRVVTFLAFAASFAVYVDRRGLQCSAVQSVEAWTSQVIETTLADYFIRSNGWDGFIEYADIYLRRVRRSRSNGHNAPAAEPGMWQLAVAAGALGLVAFTVKHVFS